MNKRFLPLLIITIFAITFLLQNESDSSTDFDLLRKQHIENLKNSPYRTTKELSKNERRNLQLPPNPYNDRIWELTMDPVLGRPRTESIYKIQEDIESLGSLKLPGVPGENPDMAWKARGPSNIGGRTNGLMFDPNDSSNRKVFAGGVSGGIFVNDNIDDENSEWRMVDGVPRNLPISVLTYDPNNTNIFYAGTGEIYTGGDALGNGLWKSLDGGNSWENIFGGRSDSEQVFRSPSNEIHITTKPNQNPINFIQASFGPNLPGYPLSSLSSEIIIADPIDACSTLSNSSQINGKIVLIEDGSLSSGNCSYFKKITEAQDAGAIAAIVFNKDTGQSNWTDDLKTMNVESSSDDPSTINIPSVFIKASDGNSLKTWIQLESTLLEIKKKTNVYSSGLEIVPGLFFINDVVVRDYNGVSEVYVAAGSTKWERVNGSRSDDQNTLLGSAHDGIYKSIDGINWTKVELYHPIDTDDEYGPYNDVYNRTVVPMDLEIDNENRIWATSTISPEYTGNSDWAINPGIGGGKLYRLNEEGTSATFINAIKTQFTPSADNVTKLYSGRRTEITFTADNKLIMICYAVKTFPGVARFVPRIYKGTVSDWINGNYSELTQPNDSDNGIEDYDFARGQGYYSISLGASPSNQNKVFIGGIDLFSSNTAGNDWGQISHWQGRDNQYLHADQHSVVFNDNDNNKILFGNDGGVGYTPDGGSLSTRNKNYHTAQYYSLAVAPVGMFDNYTTNVYGYDPLQGSWDPEYENNNGTLGGYRYKKITTINGHSDVFAGGMQDNGTSIQADNNDGLSDATDFGGGDGASTMFSQNPNNKYIVSNYVYNNSVEVLNMNNPGQNNRSLIWRISSNDDNEGDFINKQTLDSNLGIIYANAGNGNVRAYYGWDGFGASQNSLADTYIISGLGSSTTALNVSPFQTQTSTLYVGNDVGQLWKVTNAQNPNNQTRENITGNEFLGSISDIEFGSDENHIFVTFYNYGVESIFYSEDGGQNWSKKEGNLPDIPVYNILQSPLNSDEVIIGTELGIWFTNNFNSNNPSWQQANAGMKDLRVTDMDMRKGDNKVFISTYGLGIFSGIFQNSEPTFTIESDTQSIEVLRGNSESFNVSYNVYNDFNDTVTFSIEGLPNDSSANFSNNNFVIDSNGSISVEISIGNGAELGKFDLVLKAVSQTKSKQLDVELKVISDDNDGDGVLNVDDNCPDTPNTDQSDLDGDLIGDVCDPNPLPQNLFNLSVKNETCRSNNDGEISLSIDENLVPQNFSFTISISGPNNFSFTPELISGYSWSKNNIEAGNYTVCLTTSQLSNFEQCFNIIISEPQDISVLTAIVNDNSVNIDLDGSSSYNIFHNNNYYQTSYSYFELTLDKGLNFIRVTGDKDCQGVYEETIFNSEDVLLSPNPAVNTSNLWIGGNDKEIKTTMFDNAGRLIWVINNDVGNSRSIDINVSNLKPGLYYLKVDSKTVRETLKLIKK